MSQKKEDLAREENAALTAKIEAHQRAFDKSFAEIEGTEDHAKKIVKLLKLNNHIYMAERTIKNEQSNLISKRARKSAKTYFKRAGLVVASLPIATIGFTATASWVSQSSIDDKTRELKNEVNVDGFRQTLGQHQSRITTMLNETVKDCDLKEISKSLHFSDALHSHEPLRKRFDAAAIARAALGEEEQPKAAMAERQGTRLRPGAQG